MLSIKDELVRLLDDIQQNGNDFHDVEVYGVRIPDTISNEDVADRLLAGGVTVGQGTGWIPVSDALPTFSPYRIEAVLVTLQDGQGKRFTTTAKYSEKLSQWYDFNDSRFQYFQVLAWMRKPPAYDPT